MKQLAIALEAGKKFKSMKELLASSRDSSPVRERAFSAVKSLVLREKEDKFTTEFGGDQKVLSLLNSLLNAGQFPEGRLCLVQIQQQIVHTCPRISTVLLHNALLLNFLKSLEASRPYEKWHYFGTRLLLN